MRPYMLILVLLFLVNKVQSQTNNIFFSTTGDTVLCFRGATATNMRMDTLDWNMLTLAKNLNKLDTISAFKIRTYNQNLKPFSKLNNDTISKYNLAPDGVLVSWKDIETICKTNNVKMVGVTTDKHLKCYMAKLAIKVKYKTKVIGTLHTYILFKGKNNTDIDLENICNTSIWKKETKDKFFVSFRINSLGCNNITFAECSPYEEHIMMIY